MPDPVTIRTAFNVVSSGISIVKALVDNTSKRISNIEREIDYLSNRIEVQLAKIDSLTEKLDDSLSRELGASFRSLLDAAGSRDEWEMMNLLNFSYQGFTRLSCINPHGTTRIQGKALKNSLIASIGFFGRHLYFAFLKRYKDSLRQVYECTLKYPEEGVSVFDPRFFSLDYRKALIKYDEELLSHTTGDSDSSQYAILSHPYVLLVLGKAEIDGLGLDEDGVILCFEREDLIAELKSECATLMNELKGDA